MYEVALLDKVKKADFFSTNLQANFISKRLQNTHVKSFSCHPRTETMALQYVMLNSKRATFHLEIFFIFF